MANSAPINNSILDAINSFSQSMSDIQTQKYRQQQLALEKQRQDADLAPISTGLGGAVQQSPAQDPGQQDNAASLSNAFSSAQYLSSAGVPGSNQGTQSDGSRSPAAYPYAPSSGGAFSNQADESKQPYVPPRLQSKSPASSVPPPGSRQEQYQNMMSSLAQQYPDGNIPPQQFKALQQVGDAASQEKSTQATQALAKESAAANILTRKQMADAATQNAQTKAFTAGAPGGGSASGASNANAPKASETEAVDTSLMPAPSPRQNAAYQKALTSMLSARSDAAYRQAGSDDYANKKVNDLLPSGVDLNKFDPAKANIAAHEVLKIASGGTGTEGGFEGISPNTFSGKVAKAAQYFTSNPTPANQGAFLQELKDYSNEMGKTANEQMAARELKVAKDYRGVIGDTNYQTLINNHYLPHAQAGHSPPGQKNAVAAPGQSQGASGNQSDQNGASPPPGLSFDDFKTWKRKNGK